VQWLPPRVDPVSLAFSLKAHFHIVLTLPHTDHHIWITHTVSVIDGQVFTQPMAPTPAPATLCRPLCCLDFPLPPEHPVEKLAALRSSLNSSEYGC